VFKATQLLERSISGMEVGSGAGNAGGCAASTRASLGMVTGRGLESETLVMNKHE
jgi:hypothetical protein